MGQATVDLPDPLQNSKPVEAQSADDLLSQLAGDEIDRLLAESGEDSPEESPVSEALNTEAINTSAISPPLAAPEVDLDSVLDTAIAERAALQAEPVTDAPAETDHSPRIDLGDPHRRLPLFLRPLEWISSPLDPWPDQMREILGKVGLMTLINALAVIAYVMFRRHHHH